MTASSKISFPIAAGCWLAYLAFLAPVVAYALLRFAALYPADSLLMHPELSAQYRIFVGTSGVALAICLGVGAAVFGVWRGSLMQGVVALGLGIATTIAGLSIVPMVRFPEDQYPPAALFVIGNGLPLILAFVIATVAGHLMSQNRRPA